MVDTIPVPASMYRDGTYIDIEMPTFHNSLNRGHTGHVPGVPADFGCTGWYRKKIKKKKIISSFVIFEFL